MMRRWLPRSDLVQRLVVDLFRDEWLPRVRCPALLLYCRDDPLASPQRAAPLRAALRPAREATIPAGVFAANEAPEFYAQAVRDYLCAAPT